ncbi:MAG: DUF885 family protein [Candidatus Aminicenantes bacterium]|nr:DUF885 family protein [Candidatus Aminicenantes bacterium]
MFKRNGWVILFLGMGLIAFFSCSSSNSGEAPELESGTYDDLVKLFEEWREFQKPEVVNGVPDYTTDAMAEQFLELKEYQNQLKSMNFSSWPVSQRADYHVVRAEMNGLEFDHRVLRPWSRNPCFYAAYYISPSDVPALEGPWRYGTLCMWKYTFPLKGEQYDDFQMHLQAVPQVLEQAKENLTEEAKDLWFLGIRRKKQESQYLANLAERLKPDHPDLVPDILKAKQAVDEFQKWLEAKHKNMTAPSGIGVENFNWYMKNVHLCPYTWEDQVFLLERELTRSAASLNLEENRNRHLPPLKPPENREEYQRRHDEAVEHFMEFMRENVMTLPEYMNGTLKRRVRFIPPNGLRDFFTQVDYHDPLPLRCHGTHWFDLARMEHEPHPSHIRRVPLLYNIWDSRAEGLATGMEEIAMHAGLMDDKPRVRELVWIMLACRCARGLGGLKMHSNEFTLEEAVDFGVKWTPRGWMPKEGNTIWADEALYLQQPGYGTSYVVGKAHLEKLIADRAEQLGDEFDLKSFFNEFHTHGMIPLSLIRWEMTGLEDEIKNLW